MVPFYETSRGKLAQHFDVRCRADKYLGKWVVIRRRDGKVMTEDHDPRVCLRWVKAWGPGKL